jgi:hypothetical protein
MTSERTRKKPARLKLKAAIEAVLADDDAMTELAHFYAGEGEPDDAHDAIQGHLDALLAAVNTVPEKAPKALSAESLRLLDEVRAYAHTHLKPAAYAATGQKFATKYSPCVRYVAKRLRLKEAAVNSRLKRIAKSHPDAWDWFRQPMRNADGRAVSAQEFWAHVLPSTGE